MCGHRYSSLTFVRRADRRGTSERSLEEGRYWRVEESRRTATFCQDYFFKFRAFRGGLALGLRLTFASFLWFFSRSGVNSQPLVPLFRKHQNPGSAFAAELHMRLFPIRQRQSGQTAGCETRGPSARIRPQLAVPL